MKRLLAIAASALLILTGCASESEFGEVSSAIQDSQDLENASTESPLAQDDASAADAEKAELPSGADFEEVFKQLSELDIGERELQIQELGFTENSFRARAMETYGAAMPSVTWMENEIGGLSEDSVISLLASCGLFTVFEEGEPAPKDSLEASIYALDEVELRPGEVATVLFYGEYKSEPVSETAEVQTGNTAAPSPNFSVQFYVRSPLRYLDTVRGEEIYFYPRPSDGAYTSFAFDISVKPATQARCQLRNSSGVFGWEVRTDSGGTAVGYSYNLASGELGSITGFYVRCSRGDYYSDSSIFTVTG